MKFEWDAAKAANNLKIHGVLFEEAIEAFFDPNAIEGFDAEHSIDENRFYIIGFSSRRLLYVVYAEPNGDTIRIISARKAEQKKQSEYEKR